MRHETIPPVDYELYNGAIKWFAVLVAAARRRTNLEPHFKNSLDVLNTLPLNENESSLALARLRNAERYLRYNELGAGCYELVSLMRLLLQKRNA